MSIIRNTTILFIVLLLSFKSSGQNKADTEAYNYAQDSFDSFYELLQIPNDAIYPDDIMKNVEWCEEAFGSRNFQTTRIETETVPLLLAERTGKKAKKTVLVYLQIDGQPVDSSQWFQESPWIPVLKKQDENGNWVIIPDSELKDNYDPDYRIFARSASDAKGPVSMFLAAIDAIDDKKTNPNFNLKIIMDFEEELGSPRLPDAVTRNKDLLASDMLVIFDGPPHISNQPTLTYGARGIATVTLEVFGPRVPQHSGHYGNYAPNPAFRLSQLMASLKKENGRVAIPGWYDGIELSEEVKKILGDVPDDEDMIRKKIGIAEIDAVAKNYQESIQFPSLNIRGMGSGWIGKESRTIIPASATAEIDIRLVKESDPDQLIRLLKKHIEEQGYHFVDGAPTEEERSNFSKLIRFDYEISYGAFRTDFDTEIGDWLRKAMVSAHGSTPIQIRTGGGSIPISPFVNTLDIPAVIVPTVNPDNNQHSPNENIRVGNYVQGIKTMIAILSEKL